MCMHVCMYVCMCMLISRWNPNYIEKTHILGKDISMHWLLRSIFILATNSYAKPNLNPTHNPGPHPPPPRSRTRLQNPKRDCQSWTSLMPQRCMVATSGTLELRFNKSRYQEYRYDMCTSKKMANHGITCGYIDQPWYTEQRSQAGSGQANVRREYGLRGGAVGLIDFSSRTGLHYAFREGRNILTCRWL